MKDTLKAQLVKTLEMVQKAREYSSPVHPAELFKNCQQLMALQAWMIEPLLSMETAYRQKIVHFKNEEIAEEGKIKKRANAEAENMAKCTEEYTDYKYMQYVYDLVDQQIMLVKKFADKLGDESNNARGI